MWRERAALRHGPRDANVRWPFLLGKPSDAAGAFARAADSTEFPGAMICAAFHRAREREGEPSAVCRILARVAEQCSLAVVVC